uniref:Uncharacterized protein n=1 Tax=Candidatus Kentrum sp. FM TaxID=2126340 RepID=A0A450SWY0_9GAMM|nr:MAG: hypothetical protein BECKFM1743C_GA0114222_102196 [Candidatus Kentron sp. FM]VFJ58554.1 MAG: hypothetical protein BECKFM1743A_GA0114220_102183 [Candidatus Kentron sp. FM]VFK11556.1 MAG: hypothetical protein BECKFM1743B_GA0114221_101933 [Candidatus Kentron sp. FM]
MHTIEFETKIRDGIIELPRHHGPLPESRVKVILLVEDDPVSTAARPSALDVLARSPGKRLFRSAEAVDRHLRAERDAWER